MKYIISSLVYKNIRSFYTNVAKKYKHTYSYENLRADYQKACSSIYQIENGLLRREPTMSKWKGYYMAKAGKWYFAYRIEGDTIYVDDACHSQNIHDNKDIIDQIITEAINKIIRQKRVQQ